MRCKLGNMASLMRFANSPIKSLMIWSLISLFTLTYSQTVRVGKRSLNHVGSGSRPERQQSSPAASRTYSDRVLLSGIPKAGLRYLQLLTDIYEQNPHKGQSCKILKDSQDHKNPQSSILICWKGNLILSLWTLLALKAIALSSINGE